jgi:rhodanese-related sulfurtransferase
VSEATPAIPVQPGWEVSPLDVHQALQSGEDLVLLDCRTPKEHDLARIEAAILVPMQDVKARLQELLAFDDRRVVVFCHHGQRSMMVTSFLRQQGFEDVHSMAGGIDLWSRAVDPAVPRY